MKLHTILSVFISLILLCIIPGVGLLSLNLFKTRTIQSYADSRRDTLLQISDSVSEHCQKIERLSLSYSSLDYIKEMAELPPGSIDQDDFRANIDRIKRENDESFFFPEIEYEIQILFMNGLSYSSDPAHLETLLKLTETLWFYEAVKYQKDFLWQSNILFKVDEKKTNVISLVTFIRDSEGKTLGAILMNLDERELYRIYSQIIGFQSTIYLVDNKGQIASHPTLSMVGRFFYDMKIFDSFFEERDWAQIVKLGNEYLFSRYRSPENPWIVVEEIPIAVITDPLQEIANSINFLTVILLSLSIIVAIFFSKRIALPFEKLSTTMEKAGKGDLTTRFEKSGYEESIKMAENSQNFIDRIKSLIDEIKVIEQQKQNSELEFLQMQINPHFIYNTLFSIRCMVDMGDNGKAGEMLDRFTNLLQKVLRLNSPMISIMDNIDYLEDYSFILSQRFGALSLKYKVDEGIGNEKILKFILQPLVENSVFHGFADGFAEDSFIGISFERKNRDYIHIAVEDNGCGMSAEQIERIFGSPKEDKNNHIGLLNVFMKLQLYYDGKASLDIDSEVGRGTSVHITVPRRGEEYENSAG
nr:sensor histidine kinase [Spirochaeta isovalerica]